MCTQRAGGMYSAIGDTGLADLQQMIRRQRVLADFGEFALSSDDLEAVLMRACQLIGDALGTDLSKVIEVEDDGATLFVRAGVGWPEGVVGQLRLPMSERSSESYSIVAGEPVTVRDISAEERFEFPDFLKNAGVVGMVNVPIFLPGNKAYGLLQVDSREPWAPDEHEIQFLRTYAAVLGPVIDRLHQLHALRRAERRNETLLRELQHRIKNNIGVITSVVQLRMRSATSREVRDELRVVGERIEAMRLVHEQVYAADKGDRLPLHGYVTKLLGGLLALHSEAAVRLEARIDDVEIGSDTATTLGLILNEFATNSLKYAFSDEGGCIAVEARERGGRLWVSISDNGTGMTDRAREVQPGSGSGILLIERLCRQIGAKPSWASECGTSLRFDFAL